MTSNITQWGFLKFALTLIAIAAGVWLGIQMGEGNQENAHKDMILQTLEEISDEDTKIETRRCYDKPCIIDRLQQFPRSY